MKLHPRVTRTGVELVKRFEGLRRRAARLPDGGWTIGYGHTLTAREGAEVSPEDAEALLYYDLSEVAGKLDAWTFTPLNQNQFEALSAFAFNIGLDNFRHSTVLKRVNEGQHLLAGAAMELWRKADFNGEDLVVDALVRRRAAEKAHYLTPPEGFRPAPSPVLRPTFDHSVIEAAAQAQAARQATVVDVPLEGETAIAVVERASEASREARFPILPDAAPVHDTLEAPNACVDGSPPATPSWAAASARAEFRAFEPPPRRAERPESSEALHLEPASENLASHEALPDYSVKEAEAPWASSHVEDAHETSLFEQPLAPPVPAEPAQAVRAMRLTADGAPSLDSPQQSHSFGPAKSDDPGRHRFMLYASIGVLGVFLFSVAVGDMAFGKAASANLGTLLMGVVGIGLMTLAGVWFLIRRAKPLAEPAHG